MVHQRRNRYSLSPIPLDIIPVSPLAIKDTDAKSLEIHGKQIINHKSRMGLTRKKNDNNNER